MNPDLTILLPSYNEADNLPEVIPEITGVLDANGFTYEVMIVDDGSTDGTSDVVAKLDNPHIRYVRLRRNFGKSAALQAGFAKVRGRIVVLMDADGQDNPHALPKLIGMINDGYDLVTGARDAARQDRFIKRNTSKLFNGTTAWVTGVEGSDFNSGLKVMRRELVDNLNLYGEMHRYIPVLAHWSGYKVTESPVEHRPRLHGSTKFGAARFWRGMLDLITVKFITRFTARPLHLFGMIGTVCAIGGGGLLLWMLIDKILGQTIGSRPALITGVLLSLLAVQFFSIGLIGELIVHSRERSDNSWMVAEDRGPDV